VLCSYSTLLPNASRRKIFPAGVFRAVQLPAFVGLILCIVGASTASNPTEINSQPTLHAGVILFCVVLAGLAVLTAGAWYLEGAQHHSERILIYAVALALPFLLVRLIYTCLAVFSKLHDFQLIGGSETVRLVMATIEEMVVVFIFLGAGIKWHEEPRAVSPRGEETAMVGQGPKRPGGEANSV
jgi:hypothetical protein